MSAVSKVTKETRVAVSFECLIWCLISSSAAETPHGAMRPNGSPGGVHFHTNERQRIKYLSWPAPEPATQWPRVRAALRFIETRKSLTIRARLSGAPTCADWVTGSRPVMTNFLCREPKPDGNQGCRFPGSCGDRGKRPWETERFAAGAHHHHEWIQCRISPKTPKKASENPEVLLGIAPPSTAAGISLLSAPWHSPSIPRFSRTH